MSKILILDDDPSVNESLKDILEEAEFDVFATTDYNEAKTEFEKNRFDLAIVDLKLPISDGETVLKEFKEINNSTKFILYTGSLDYSLNEDMLEMFGDDLILFYKPILDIDAFIAKIESLLR